jgi:hypothetical protein
LVFITAKAAHLGRPLLYASCFNRHPALSSPSTGHPEQMGGSQSSGAVAFALRIELRQAATNQLA